MREKGLRAKVFAVQLTVDQLELVEKICNGSIKGIKLPRKDRIIHFYFGDQEHELSMTDWYVEFRCADADRTVIKQVWPDKQFKAIFRDIDHVAY